MRAPPIGAALGPPAERKGAADQCPMAADGAIGVDLKVGPAQFLLDLLVALLHPLPQAAESYHLGQVGGGQVGMLGGGLRGDGRRGCAT